MRTAALGLVVLFLAPLAQGALPPTDLREPILIRGDAELTPENGVRRGSGTEGDPYVIAGWRIRAGPDGGVRITGTTRHLLIEDVHVFGTRVVCVGHACPPAAFVVEDASNVSIQRVQTAAVRNGIQLARVSDATVMDVSLGAFNASTILRTVVPGAITNVDSQLDTGITVSSSTRVLVENVRIQGVSDGIRATDVQSLTVKDTSLDAAFFGLSIGGSSSDIKLDGLYAARGTISFTDAIEGVSVARSVFEDSALGLAPRYESAASFRNVSICENRFLARPSVALWVFSATGIDVLGNRFEGVEDGASVSESSDVRVVGNRFAGPADFAMVFRKVARGEVAANAFEADGGRVIAYDAEELSLAGNWWGSPDGPSLDGPGQGAPLQRVRSDAPYAPWLTARPALGDCFS